MPLDETINEGDPGHIADHEVIAVNFNRDPMSYRMKLAKNTGQSYNSGSLDLTVFQTFTDPQGWVNTTAINDVWYGLMPANSTFKLPAGVYFWSIVQQWPHNAVGQRWAYVSYGGNDGANFGVTYDVSLAMPLSHDSLLDSGGFDYYYADGSVTVGQSANQANLNFFVAAVQYSGGPLSSSYCTLTLTRTI